MSCGVLRRSLASCTSEEMRRRTLVLLPRPQFSESTANSRGGQWPIRTEGRQEFLMQETIKCLFIEENHARWLNNITHPLRQSHVVTIPTEEEPANIFSPLHLIVDALATRFVWPHLWHSNFSGTERTYLANIKISSLLCWWDQRRRSRWLELTWGEAFWRLEKVRSRESEFPRRDKRMDLIFVWYF